MAEISIKYRNRKRRKGGGNLTKFRKSRKILKTSERRKDSISKLAMDFHFSNIFHLSAKFSPPFQHFPSFSKISDLLGPAKVNKVKIFSGPCYMIKCVLTFVSGVQEYEVPFVKYVLHALYGQFYAFPILSQNSNDKSWTAFCGL